MSYLVEGLQQPHYIQAGPSSGSVAGVPTYRPLVDSDLPTSGVTAGTYLSLTVDQYGRVVAGSNPTYAPLDSPTFTGNPTGPTPTAGNNSTALATTAFVTNAVTTAAAAKYFHGYVSSTTTLGAAASPTQLPIGVEVRKDTGYFSHASGSSQTTVLVAGWYKISVEATMVATTGSCKGVMQLYKNGTAITYGICTFGQYNNGYQATPTITIMIQLAVNDVIDWKAWYTNGGFQVIGQNARFMMETA